MYNDLFSIGPLTIHGYGLMIGIGVLVALFWSASRARRSGLSDDTVFSLGLWGVITGFLGAKLLFVITEFRAFLADPLAVLGTEGFVVYGGLVVGFSVAWLVARRRHEDFAAYVDAFVPAVALAQALGRIGCFLAGCCYGKATSSPLGVHFPAGSFAPSGVALWPVQLFSALGDLIICVILLRLEKRQKHTGTLCGSYLVLYGIGRFLIEFLRDDPRGAVGIFSTSQFISLIIVPVGVALILLLRRRGERLLARMSFPADADEAEEAPEAGAEG